MNATNDHTTSPKVFLETFGCQMNVLDSQLVRDQLASLGYRFVTDWRQADVVLYNTCSVREHAEQKVWSRIGQVGIHKQNNPGLVLGIIGCMAEREGLNMTRKHPQIDLLVGPGELDKVATLIDNAMRTDLHHRGGSRNAGIALQGNTHRRTATLAAAEDQLERIDLARSFSPDEHHGSAYVRITRGCNKFCTYCVVPNTRGAEVHRPPQHLLEECRKLVASGIKEITLLGQTVNHYHFDHAKAVEMNGHLQPQVGAVVRNEGNNFDAKQAGHVADRDDFTTFAKLLAMLHDQLPDLERLRFVTSFPRDFGDDILQVMAERPRICRYLHLPVQSGSNRMLKLMNRGYTVEQYMELVQRVRTFLPDAEIATDIICGFPTETEEDHEQTKKLLRDCRFKNAFIFKYSPRPGTVAMDRFEDDVSDKDKKRRNNELLAIQHEASLQVHEAYVGRKVKVFVESISSQQRKANERSVPKPGGLVELGWEKQSSETGEASITQTAVVEPQTQGDTTAQLTGRTHTDLIVCFDGDTSMVGEMIEVSIERAGALTLFGKLA